MRAGAHGRGYDRRWEKAAQAFKRANPLCLGCDAVGVVAAAEVVDHVVPHKGDQFLFWDHSRWQSACKWHHDVVKQQLELRYGKGALAEADLWLNSPAAVAVTKRERFSIGVDGWAR